MSIKSTRKGIEMKVGGVDNVRIRRNYSVRIRRNYRVKVGGMGMNLGRKESIEACGKLALFKAVFRPGLAAVSWLTILAMALAGTVRADSSAAATQAPDDSAQGTSAVAPGRPPVRPLAEAPGWGGELAVVAGVNRKQSQFETDDDNRVTADLDNSGQQTSEVLAFPLARLDYTLPSLKTQYFLGNSRDNVAKGQIAIEFGVTHRFEDQSQVTAAYFPRLPFSGETWKDPFLQDQSREETLERAQGGRLTLENIAGSRWTAEYAVAVNRVDDEQSGASLVDLDAAERGLLNRDALLQRARVELRVPLGPGLFLKPGLYYTIADANGAANSFDQTGLQVQAIRQRGTHFLTATFDYSQRRNDADNPVFGAAQKDDLASLFLLYSHFDPFGWKNWSLLAVGYWQSNDSNIGFYDEEGFGAGVGLGYRWR